jgi:hypothetical protein
MKDRAAQLTASRKQLLRQMPELSTILPGSLWSRMVRCNKPGCRFCEKGKGKGHGPIWILSVSLGNRQVRQIPIPGEMKKEGVAARKATACPAPYRWRKTKKRSGSRPPSRYTESRSSFGTKPLTPCGKAPATPSVSAFPPCRDVYSTSSWASRAITIKCRLPKRQGQPREKLWRQPAL